MIDQKKPRDFSLWGEKQARNRYSSAGITAREANMLWSMVFKLRKLENKNNLYVGHAQRILDARLTLELLLEEADRA
tara:strand:- start:471 stop:701 length:231 start_codon:yes stop_codon:yes gene_type:complete